MTATSAALLSRRAAESLMTSTCTVFESGEPVTDPNTGEVTDSHETIWFGPCRVRPGGRGTQTNSAEAVGDELFVFDYLISVPFSVTEVIEGHRVTITESPDPALVGITVEVQKVDRGDHISARRLACQEVS